MSRLITVEPIAEGWRLSSNGDAEPVIFSSGAKAEAAARALALELSDQGCAVKIEIWLRDGRLAGRLVCTGRAGGLSVAA